MIGDHNLGIKGGCEWPHLVNSAVAALMNSASTFPENSTLEPHRPPVLSCKKLEEEVKRLLKAQPANTAKDSHSWQQDR